MDDDVFPDSVEPDYYPNSNVLVNKLNITDYSTLQTTEADCTTIRSIELFQSPSEIKQSFDFEHLSAIHRFLFQDLYDWAGKPRSFDIKK